MEFEPSVAVWRSRGTGTVLDVSAVNGKDGSKLVLITTREEVLEYCTQSRKCVNHWTFRAGSNVALRIGAVRNPLSQVLFGVRGSKKANQAETIVAWRNSDLEVAKWKSAALSEKTAVAGLYVHPQLTEEVVVVYENGKFAIYDEDLTKLLDASDAPANGQIDEAIDGHVVWTTVASDHRNPLKGSLFLSLLVKSKANASTYELVIYQVFAKKDRKDARVAVSLVARQPIALESSSSAEITSSAFHAETLSYSFVWSTGEWQMASFRNDVVSNTLEWTSTQRIATLSSDHTTPSSLTAANKKRKLAQAGSSGFTSCSVGNFSYLVISSASNPKALTGWDAKFGVQVASTEVDFSVPEQSEGDVTKSATAAVGSMRKLLSSLNGEVVVAAYDHAVFVVNVKNKYSTLASVLGASKGAVPSAGAPALPNTVINWSEVASKKEADAAVAYWKDNVCKVHTAEEQYIADLSDPVVTSTAAQFTKKFDEAVKKLSSGNFSYRFLIATTKRCVDSADKLALWGPLKTLIASKRISARAVPALLPTLMKHAQYELLELAIRDLTDIDERSIVRLLKFFVRKTHDAKLIEYVASSTNNSKSAASPGGKRKKPSPKSANGVAHNDQNEDNGRASERFVVAVLGLPTNNVFLHHAIRELQLDDVLFLLTTCKKFFFALTMAHDDKEDDNDTPTSSSKKSKQANGAGASTSSSLYALGDESLYFTKLPSALQFTAWICALIDGHFAQLVLASTKDARVAKALQTLDALVQKHVVACEQLETVTSVLSNFLSGVKLPQAHGIPDYSIEELLI
ncbi:hypothetical protein FI667_g12682, partial [Globisporangium splendens]